MVNDLLPASQPRFNPSSFQNGFFPLNITVDHSFILIMSFELSVILLLLPPPLFHFTIFNCISFYFIVWSVIRKQCFSVSFFFGSMTKYRTLTEYFESKSSKIKARLIFLQHFSFSLISTVPLVECYTKFTLQMSILLSCDPIVHKI